MKKFLYLLSVVMLLFVATNCTQQQTTIDKPDKVEAVQTTDQWQTAAVVELDAPVYLVQDLDPPSADYGDVLQIPGKDASKSDWFYWAISAIVLVLWEVVFRLVPTSKSVSILTLFYNLFNLLIKDRASSGGIFKVKEVQRE